MNIMRRIWRWSDTELGLGVAVFNGNKGDRKVDQYVKDCTREECPFSTGLVRGSLLKEIAPQGVQRLYKPGETTEGDPDITEGFVQVVALEDDTALICIGPVSEITGQFDWLRMGKKTHRTDVNGRRTLIPKGHVCALVFGSVVLPDKSIVWAPEVIAAKQGDIFVVIQPNTTMMEGWRIWT